VAGLLETTVERRETDGERGKEKVKSKRAVRDTFILWRGKQKEHHCVSSSQAAPLVLLLRAA
jgi:hypothetical protein